MEKGVIGKNSNGLMTSAPSCTPTLSLYTCSFPSTGLLAVQQLSSAKDLQFLITHQPLLIGSDFKKSCGSFNIEVYCLAPRELKIY